MYILFSNVYTTKTGASTALGYEEFREETIMKAKARIIGIWVVFWAFEIFLHRTKERTLEDTNGQIVCRLSMALQAFTYKRLLRE